MRRTPRAISINQIGEALLSADPPIKSLLVVNGNPGAVAQSQAKVTAGLLRDDLFTVVHELFVTDTALYADYVLPATSQIEHLDLSPAWGHLYLALNRPAIAPRGESVSNTELFRRLARALGRTEAYLFESDESMLRAAMASGHPWLDGITYEPLSTPALFWCSRRRLRIEFVASWRVAGNGTSESSWLT